MKRAAIHANFPNLAPLDNLFDDWFLKEFPELKNSNISCAVGAYPKMDAYEYVDSVKLIAEIPGLSKKDLDINVERNMLTITGTRRPKSEDDGEQCCKVIWSEIKKSSFQRKIRLDDKLNSDKISAKFEDGELTIIIPKLVPDDKIKKEIEIE